MISEILELRGEHVISRLEDGTGLSDVGARLQLQLWAASQIPHYPLGTILHGVSYERLTEESAVELADAPHNGYITRTLSYGWPLGALALVVLARLWKMARVVRSRSYRHAVPVLLALAGVLANACFHNASFLSFQPDTMLLMLIFAGVFDVYTLGSPNGPRPGSRGEDLAFTRDVAAPVPRLLLFMTPGNGLATWRRVGTISRELAPYREYVRRGWAVTLATFDEPRAPFEEAAGISLAFCPPARLLFTLPWTSLRRTMGAVDVIKTNQSAGSWWYVLAARLWRKPILLRCGYVVGQMLESTRGRTARTILYQLREGWAFRNSTRCIVPTEALKGWVCSRYGLDEGKVTVVPNFIDTGLFRPVEHVAKLRRSVIAVGNISPVKNLPLLVRACARAQVSKLTLVGSGPDESAIKTLSSELGVAVDFRGRVPNQNLPEVLQRHEVYAVTSLWEGHPKALIEALACGMPCVGSRVTGVREVISDGVTGLLTELDAAGVAEALKRLFEDGALREELGRNAARDARERYGFDTVFEREYAVVTSLLEMGQ